MKMISLETRLTFIWFIAASLFGCISFLVYANLYEAQLPVDNTFAMIGTSVLFGGALISIFVQVKSLNIVSVFEKLFLSILLIASVVMFLSRIVQLSGYIILPVDLLSFAESPFINDILKIKLGIPIYTSPQDNNSYPYTPGTQILTYFISLLAGYGDSISFYRIVGFSYLVIAAVFAAGITDLLLRQMMENYKNRLLWICVWFLLLFLLTTDSNFNQYTISLHNDGLALLVSTIAYWLLVKYSLNRNKQILGLMAVIPALGFLVKQNQILWVGLFLIYLIWDLLVNKTGKIAINNIILFVSLSGFFISIVIAISYFLWGNNFVYWIFIALGEKQVSIARSVLHLFQAGIYAVMGLIGGWVLIRWDQHNKMIGLWGIWLILFLIEAYTSGIGFQTNHLGPGILIGACWFFVGLLKVWPSNDNLGNKWKYFFESVFAVSIVVLLFGALGFISDPRNPVPDDFYRYVADIEAEFNGYDADKILLDTGTWIYLENNLLMKDRSAPVSLHVGSNQPNINTAMLAETIERIETQQYEKILARQLDTGDTWYDFQDRGSGVKSAILSNYHEISRIRAVEGIEKWWPIHLISEIIVYVPNR